MHPHRPQSHASLPTNQTPGPTRNHSMNRPPREECWSDGATETLIDAWGDRYVRLNRSHLRQSDWKEIAAAVNGRQDGVKPQKTDVQCKNRVDTLKKKYKAEKSKPVPSNWAFYHRLHSLIGDNNDNSSSSSKKPNTTVTLTVKTRPGLGLGRLPASERKKRAEAVMEVSEEAGGAVRELARAIVRFGEIYERVERSKQEQMMELENQRMEFVRDLELRRMNVFVDSQLEAQRMKRSKCATNSDSVCKMR